MIVATGNCQVQGWARTLRLLFPNTEVHMVGAHELRDEARIADIEHRMRIADYVFALPWDDSWGSFAASRITSLNDNVIFIPSFDFNGLHPDLTYIFRDDMTPVRGPLADYHSALCIAGYICGFSQADTIGLYNGLTYRRVGYFDIYAAAKAEVCSRYAAYGYQIDRLFPSWEARAPFTMSLNHPNHFVLADIIKHVCQIKGIGQVLDIDYGGLFGDDLTEGPIFPIYPEIGRPFGISGHYIFKAPGHGLVGAPLLDLETFVARSYDVMFQEEPDLLHRPHMVRHLLNYLETL